MVQVATTDPDRIVVDDDPAAAMDRMDDIAALADGIMSLLDATVPPGGDDTLRNMRGSAQWIAQQADILASRYRRRS